MMVQHTSSIDSAEVTLQEQSSFDISVQGLEKPPLERAKTAPLPVTCFSTDGTSDPFPSQLNPSLSAPAYVEIATATATAEMNDVHRLLESLRAECDSQGCLTDGVWGISDKSSTVDACDPDQPSLQRNIDPMTVAVNHPAENSSTCPPPLSLEFFETEDCFRPTPKMDGNRFAAHLVDMPPSNVLTDRDVFEPVENECGFASENATSLLKAFPLEHLSLQRANTDPVPVRVALTETCLAASEAQDIHPWLPPPPPLSFENFVTDDPFQPSCDVRLDSQRPVAVEDMEPWVIEAKNTFLDVHPLEELSLQQASIDSVATCTKEFEDLLCTATAPLLDLNAAPPELSLEHFSTDDPFQPTSNELEARLQHFSPMPVLELSAAGPSYHSIPKSSAPTLSLVNMPLTMSSMTFVGPPPPPLAPAPLITPAAPTRPPGMVAPTMSAPESPEPPRAPPSQIPGASAASLPRDQLRQPGIVVNTCTGCTHVHWAVDARKLQREDKTTVSPVFSIILPGYGPAPFKVMLYAKVMPHNGKKGAGFLKAKGCGRVVLKCESQLPESFADVAFRVGIGRDDVLQPFRGPVVHNFFEHSCHGLMSQDEEWDFTTGIDENSTFVVTVEISPKSAFMEHPNIWWAAIQDDKQPL